MSTIQKESVENSNILSDLKRELLKERAKRVELEMKLLEYEEIILSAKQKHEEELTKTQTFEKEVMTVSSEINTLIQTSLEAVKKANKLLDDTVRSKAFQQICQPGPKQKQEDILPDGIIGNYKELSLCNDLETTTSDVWSTTRRSILESRFGGQSQDYQCEFKLIDAEKVKKEK